MVLKLLMALALPCAACSDLDQSVEQLMVDSHLEHPSAGQYSTIEGEIFDIDTDGPATVGVKNEETGLCLQFWRENKPIGEDGLLKLKGQECSNKTFGDLDWTAIYSYKRPNVFLLYPPGVFEEREVTPIEISLVDPNN